MAPLGHHQLQKYPLLLETEVFIGFGPHRYFTLSGRGPCGSGAALLDAGVESSTANQPSAGGAGTERWKPRGIWGFWKSKRSPSECLQYLGPGAPPYLRGNKQNTKALFPFTETAAVSMGHAPPTEERRKPELFGFF